MLNELLDLDSWASYSGLTSIDGAKCPFCGTLQNADLRGLRGIHTCEQCDVPFCFVPVETPLGPGFMTFKKDR